jgi:O-antigen/teichoic acid export membrane protein
LIATKNQSKLLKINIIVTIVNIIWNVLLIPHYSFIWAWVITLLSQILLMILWYIYTVKIINFIIPWKLIFKNIILWIIMFNIWYYLLNYHSVGIYFDVLVYGTTIFILYGGILTYDIKRTFSNRKELTY